MELEPEPLEKKTRSRSQCCLGKKSGAGAGATWKKKSGARADKKFIIIKIYLLQYKKVQNTWINYINEKNGSLSLHEVF